MKKWLKTIFVDYVEVLYMIGIIYGVVAKNKDAIIVFGIFCALVYMGSLKIEIKKISDRLQAKPRTIFTIEKDNEKYTINRRFYTDQTFVEQNIYGVFRFDSDAKRYCHLLNTKRWDKYIGTKVCVASNAGCYVNYEEFFDINDCVATKEEYSTYDIPTDEEYEVVDVGFDSNLNKILVLKRLSFRCDVYLYRYSDLENDTPNIFEIF